MMFYTRLSMKTQYSEDNNQNTEKYVALILGFQKIQILPPQPNCARNELLYKRQLISYHCVYIPLSADREV